MNKISVLIIDDHAILRMGLASLLNAKKDIEVVGDAADGATGIRKAVRLQPDVVIMDLMMPGMDGTETTRQLLSKAPDSKVLILTTFGMPVLPFAASPTTSMPLFAFSKEASPMRRIAWSSMMRTVVLFIQKGL